jgi:lactate dehydrogenase-like 2-hydroxyacid dehydrogenase
MVITPGGPATLNMINADVLKALGSKGILINMARGSVVDEKVLIEALRSKTILSAGLDVFVGEPNVNPELLTLDNLTVLPHLGSASAYTRDKMGQMVVDNLAAYLARKPPVSPVPETPFKGW